jgi:lysophospholipase L1-like esterase
MRQTVITAVALAAAALGGQAQEPPARIVILGSSTAGGAGASRPERSWAALLSAALAPAGYTVINRSLAADTTAGAIARFGRDVAPLRPAYVVLATSIYNEGITGSPKAAWTRYVENLARLVDMTSALGATAVVMGPYPNDAANVEVQALIETLYQQLSASGARVWDFFNPVADGRGHWLPGLTVDGIHPSDQGHFYLFDSVPLGTFRGAYLQEWRRGRLEGLGGCALQRETSLVFSRPSMSWTVGVAARYAAGTRTLLAMPELELRVDTRGSSIEVAQGGNVLAIAAFPEDAAWHDIYVTRKDATGRIELYLDGVSVASSWGAPRGAISQVTAPSLAEDSGADVRLATAYRTPLDEGALSALRRGAAVTKSAEAWPPPCLPAARRGI